jgi:fructan beta-fructosidase
MNSLELDLVTSPPTKTAGVDGDGALLEWREAEGVTTRLFASGDALQTDGFGFSFWMKPSHLSPGENLIAKEMPPDGGPDFTRLAWQVQVGNDNGAGVAPLELVVRGGDRSNGNFFGSVNTPVTLPLWTPMDEWVHVAGGYDASTGALCIYLNGRDASAHGRPGAKHADGSWFSAGTVRNGIDFVRFGALAAIDDIQVYDAPLSAYEVTWLRKNPGSAVTPGKHFKTTGFAGGPAGDQWVTFNSHNGWYYTIEASTTMETFIPVATIRASGESTTTRVTPAQINGALGGAPRPRLFFRVRALIEDPVDGSVDLPPAEILPFVNTAAYVPQFHFSWPNAAVGDPTGVLRYDGSYHLFTWDHAVSGDLLYWDGQGWPLGDTPPDSGYWTGSVVVDKDNTSGFGSLSNPAMVAIYTIHNNSTGKETIGISYSTNYRDFTQYQGNPVISTEDHVFRDPDVFWHEPSQRWVLLVARSEAKQIRFYSSPDLKNWTHISDFGGSGASNEIWEVPGLAELPIRGMGNQKKWMLHIGAGTNKVQYWVGNFDGTGFTMDEPTRAYLEDGAGIDGVLFADFEQANWQDTGWTVTGNAFGGEPAPRWWGQPAQSHLGQRLASSHVDGDWHVDSTLTSPEFTITSNCINFLIGGGNHPGETCVNLLVGGNVVRSATGDDSDVMRWAGWNVAEFKGQTARIQVVDKHGGFWGRIYVDQIMFSDLLVDHRREHAKWVELSPDFFAPKFLRDFDGTETDVKWLGWIGSWEYEANRPVPEDWGKGAESIFRKLQLVASPRGYELAQEPVAEMQALRGPIVNALPRNITGTATLTEFQPATNTYEIEAVFTLGSPNANFGLNLCVGDSQRVVVGFDASSSNLYLDRRDSGFVSLSPSFPRVVNALLLVHHLGARRVSCSASTPW